MKVLLTGANGFIGRRLAELLLKEGHSVSVLVRNKESIAEHAWSKQIQVFEGDITIAEQVHSCCREQEVIIHAAGLAHIGASIENHKAVNFHGTLNILDAAIKERVRKIIYISSSKAKEASSAYGKAKHDSEQLLLSAYRKGQIEACSLRPVAVFGPGMKGNIAAWIGAIKSGKAPILPPISTRIAMIGLDDLCRAVLLAASNDKINGKNYEIADNFAYNIKEIEGKIRLSLGKAVRLVFLPKPLFYCAAVLGSIILKMGGPSIGFNKSSYATLFIDEYEKNSAFEVDSGFKPNQNFFAELDKIIKQS